MSEHTWRPGDRVIHAARPEWGAGQVVSATSFREEGRDAQRLTIRFERAGTKTVSTLVATLRGTEEAGSGVSARQGSPEAAPADRRELARRLAAIPDAASDPFRPLASRLEATVGLFRFEGSGKALLDWAAAQTGLADPLSQFSRHDLEEAFGRFRTNLNAHLKTLVRQARKEEPSALAGLGNKATPAVRELLTRMLTER